MNADVPPKRTGIYYIKDNIAQLELEVQFRHVNSLLKLPKFNYAHRTTGSPQTHLANDNETPLRRVRLKWQQKLLSPSEVELYKDAHNCSTDIQKQYHQWLAEESKSSKISKKKKKRTPKASDQPSHQFGHGGEIFTYVHEDNFMPPLESHKHEETATFMYIYAALTPDTQLAVLRWFAPQRQLHIYPDFNDFHLHPYYITIDTDYRHLYAYGLRNVSLKRRRSMPVATNFLHLPELDRFTTSTAHWSSESKLAAQFVMPPKRCKRVVLLFEVISARHFDCDNLHVRYCVQLPPHTVLEEGLLEASTHSSSSSSALHFGYTWQLTLLGDERHDEAHRLHVYFELVSIDSWQRERVEGYAYYACHLLPGGETVQLQCLRPAEGLKAKLERYFIGGRRQFDYVKYFAVPEEQTELHNRYGFRMKSTGELRVRCQRLVQRNCELLQPCADRTSGMTLDDIMQSYMEARKRLEAVTLR